MENTLLKLKEKLQSIIETTSKEVELKGFAKISTCNYRNWDADIWNHRNDIISALEGREYQISKAVNHGVLDINIKKKFNLI